MNIQIEQKEQETIAYLSGRLDTLTSPELETCLNDLEPTSLILDLKDLEYISSAGLRVLLARQKKVPQKGPMKIRNVNSEIMEVFDITGFTAILTIE